MSAAVFTFGAENKGIGLVLTSGTFVMTNYTATVLAAPGIIGKPLGVGKRLSPVTIANDGLSGTYIMHGTDFTQTGPWVFQLEVVNNAETQLYTSPLTQVFVYGNVAALQD